MVWSGFLYRTINHEFRRLVFTSLSIGFGLGLPTSALFIVFPSLESECDRNPGAILSFQLRFLSEHSALLKGVSDREYGGAGQTARLVIWWTDKYLPIISCQGETDIYDPSNDLFPNWNNIAAEPLYACYEIQKFCQLLRPDSVVNVNIFKFMAVVQGAVRNW